MMHAAGVLLRGLDARGAVLSRVLRWAAMRARVCVTEADR